MSVYKQYLGHFLSLNRFGSYPFCLAVAESTFYMTNFFRMRVLMSPTSFNQKLAPSLVTNMDNYMGESKIFNQKIPKFQYIYKGALTTSIPYTVSNWGLRISFFRNLNFTRESVVEQCLLTYTAAFVSGVLGSFLTAPLYKLYLSNHHLQSLGKMDYKYKTIYDSVFVETKYANNKNNYKKKFGIWYRYSTAISLRGGVQSGIALGTFSFYSHLLKLRGVSEDESYQFVDFITSSNPLLDKLMNLNYYKDNTSDKKDEYRIILKSSFFAAFFTSIIMSGVDLYFTQILKDALINKNKKLNFRKQLTKLRRKNIVGKNIMFLLFANGLRYFSLLTTWNLLEEYATISE